MNYQGTHSSPNKASSFPGAGRYWPVDMWCISRPALTDWRLRTQAPCPREGFCVQSRHRITMEGHLDRQVAELQAPPLGLHTSLPPWSSLSAREGERRRNGRKKRENSEGESSDRELERLIKQAQTERDYWGRKRRETQSHCERLFLKGHSVVLEKMVKRQIWIFTNSKR